VNKKYRIDLSVSGEDPRALGVQLPRLPWYLRWLGVKIEYGNEPNYTWVWFGKKNYDKAEIVYFDRDRAKWIMHQILMGHHQERGAWITKWDVLKMAACIPVTRTDPVMMDGKQHFLLRHANYVELSLVDTETNFTVFRQEMNFLTYQQLRLQD
jgi:hypothetical protein